MSGMPLEFQVAGERRRAALWLPPNFDPGTRWPLVLALHGYGERGDDLEHTRNGLAQVLSDRPELYSAIVALPQCPGDRVWSWIDRPWAQGQGGAEEHVDALLETVLSRLPIDPDRVALTGNSMGGFGSFLIAAQGVERFHAVLPICGGGHPEEACAFGEVPVWIHHGRADDVVPAAESERMAAALRDAGARVRLDLHDGVGHESWDRVWSDPAVASFLCTGRLPGS